MKSLAINNPNNERRRDRRAAQEQRIRYAAAFGLEPEMGKRQEDVQTYEELHREIVKKGK